ncbi:hypothetical protein DFH09DRAFT_1427652 [Mycena vulgaris]|nr:hypothetical protein DFH09DRAFT_1427652 [Mycena vulgaris]
MHFLQLPEVPERSVGRSSDVGPSFAPHRATVALSERIRRLCWTSWTRQAPIHIADHDDHDFSTRTRSLPFSPPATCTLHSACEISPLHPLRNTALLLVNARRLVGSCSGCCGTLHPTEPVSIDDGTEGKASETTPGPGDYYLDRCARLPHVPLAPSSPPRPPFPPSFWRLPAAPSSCVDILQALSCRARGESTRFTSSRNLMAPFPVTTPPSFLYYAQPFPHSIAPLLAISPLRTPSPRIILQRRVIEIPTSTTPADSKYLCLRARPYYAHGCMIPRQLIGASHFGPARPLRFPAPVHAAATRTKAAPSRIASNRIATHPSLGLSSFAHKWLGRDALRLQQSFYTSTTPPPPRAPWLFTPTTPATPSYNPVRALWKQSRLRSNASLSLPALQTGSAFASQPRQLATKCKKGDVLKPLTRWCVCALSLVVIFAYPTSRALSLKRPGSAAICSFLTHPTLTQSEITSNPRRRARPRPAYATPIQPRLISPVGSERRSEPPPHLECAEVFLVASFDHLPIRTSLTYVHLLHLVFSLLYLTNQSTFDPLPSRDTPEDCRSGYRYHFFPRYIPTFPENDFRSLGLRGKGG